MKSILLFITMVFVSKASFSQNAKADTLVDDDPRIFTKTEIPAKFPGGDTAWATYLKKNINTSVGIKYGAPKGTYSIIIRFIVSKKGTISDVTSETIDNYGFEEEGIRLIKASPKWLPAIQNGREVNAFTRKTFTFKVE